jgi:AraC-like DNA-binding protein
MTPQAPNTLIAHKAISLASELSNSEKRVAAAIIDHFNRRTGQCDPSLDCIAELIGMSRRTVMRATSRYGRAFCRSRLIGRDGEAPDEQDLMHQSCHLVRVNHVTLVVTRLSPKPFLVIF